MITNEDPSRLSEAAGETTAPGENTEPAGAERTLSLAPKVTLALPVRNGAAYLPAAIPAYLSQSFADFELLISDNASTDATEQICREFAARDPRIRYIRQESNIGMIPNFEAVRSAGRGDYFRWGSVDDEIGPGYLAACVAALDADPEVVLAQGRCYDIDEHGAVLVEQPPLDTAGPDPRRRLQGLLGLHESLDLYGVIRADALRTVRAMPTHPECDRVILAGLALRGRFVQVTDAAFRRRVHAAQTMGVRRTSERVRIHDPKRSGFTLPAWELGFDLLREIHRAPLTRRQRRGCYVAMHVWLRHNYMKMAKNLVRAAIELVGAARRRLRPASRSAAPGA